VVAVSGDNVFTFIQRVEEWGVALHASNISTQILLLVIFLYKTFASSTKKKLRPIYRDIVTRPTIRA